MPRDGPLSRLDPESVSDTPPTRLVTVPRLALGVHLLVAAIFLTVGALAAAGGQPVQGVILAALGGMFVLAGWAAGRLAARR
ncbi:MAG: hypothetical protein ABEH47_08390 [Haloferacaceae archaeon]